MAGAVFTETEDSIEESVEYIVNETWRDLSEEQRRLRKGMLKTALALWIEEGFVVVPDNYREF